MTRIDLEDDETALVLRDGDIELMTPEMDGDAIVGDDVLICMAFMFGFREPEFRNFMLGLFQEKYLASHN